MCLIETGLYEEEFYWRLNLKNIKEFKYKGDNIKTVLDKQDLKYPCKKCVFRQTENICIRLSCRTVLFVKQRRKE